MMTFAPVRFAATVGIAALLLGCDGSQSGAPLGAPKRMVTGRP
jgi:hypothetical protein